jgi:DNA mismatch repair ATPase MutS
MQDLEDTYLFDNIEAFAQNMREMRKHLIQAEKLYYKLQKERCFLEAVEMYCDAMTRLARDLSVAELTSRGFLAFREYVNRLAVSDHFTALLEQTQKLLSDLSAIHYNVHINGLTVQVRHYGGELDYSAEIEATFERFKQGAVEDYVFSFHNSLEMDHVEAEILALVAQLHPEVFVALDNFYAANKDYLDDTIVTFDREIQFYIAYREYASQFKEAGLDFCYPRVVQGCKEVYNYRGFDLALAGKLISEKSPVVCNNFHLKGSERMIVVSGPNQGGKTTFARAFGQVHYLANLGCPVPGTRAQLVLFDSLFTHFEREENLHNLRGKLQDDLVRVHHILERATPNSIIIMNEIFTSTTLRDAVHLSKKIAEKLVALDLLCVWVTFVEELASLGKQTVSMVSTVVPENPAVRTFKIIRRPADGLAYAMAIAEKYCLTYSMIKERIGS